MQSLVFMAFGMAIIATALKVNIPDSWDVSPPIIKGVLLFVGALFFACNVADLFAPQAASIHRLLLDIRG